MLRIATYNVEWFFAQEFHRALMFNLKLCPLEDKAKKLARKILSLPPVHVVCLQEVQDEQALQLLCRELGKEWRCVAGLFASSRTDQRVGLVYSAEAVELMEHDSYVSTGGMQKNQWVRVRLAGRCFFLHCQSSLKVLVGRCLHFRAATRGQSAPIFGDHASGAVSRGCNYCLR